MFIEGLVIGSFLNVVIYRMPRGISINAHSYCTECDNRLKARHLIPLISQLMYKSKCEYCGKSFGWNHFIFELMSGVAFACLTYFNGFGITTIIYSICIILATICIVYFLPKITK